MNPIGAIILAVLVVLVVGGSRRMAVLGMMGGVLYLTQHQQLEVAGLNLFAVRFLELAGFIRVMARREFSFAQLNGVDRALILLYSYTAIVYCLRAKEGQAYIIGNSVDAFLCYFAFRGMIHDLEDLKSFLHTFLFLLVPYAMLVLLESVTMHNPFAFLGGGMYDWVRNGRLRCVGTFRNPDLLGTLGAAFLPLYVARFCTKEDRKLAAIGIGCCLIVVWACNSGGPISATAAGAVGWGLWRIRGKMWIFRRGLVGVIVLAAIVMKAPVWYLIARASEITGGDGWHRAFLMDVSFQHLGMWWLAGLPIVQTAAWFPYAFDTGADITNEFISFGLNAGVVAIALLILILKRAYSSLSEALEAVRARSEEAGEGEFLLWGMGAMLAAHIINWLGITYFDQSYFIWFMQLATVAGISESCIKAPVTQQDAESGAAGEAGDFDPEMVADQAG